MASLGLRATGGAGGSHGYEVTLPAEPFVAWLNRINVSAMAENHVAHRVGRDDLQPLATRVGYSQRRLRDHFQVKDGIVGAKQDEIPLHLVDRMVTHEGGFSLHDIFSSDILAELRYSGRQETADPLCPECGIEMIRRARRCGFCEEERQNNSNGGHG